MTLRDRMSAAAAVAVLLCCGAFVPVFATPAWIPRTLGAVLVVAAVSVLSRRAGLPRLLQPPAALLALVAYLVVVFVPSSLSHGVLPGRATVAALRALVADARADLQDYGPPAPVSSGLALLTVSGVGAVAVIVDALAAVLRRPAVAGLALLGLFAVPSALLPGGLGWLPFVLGAAGWLSLLLVQGRHEAAHWGTTLRAPTQAEAAGLGRVGRRIGGAALGFAVVVPALLPGLDARLFDNGSGDGLGGGGSRSIVTYNPITRLRGELTLPEPVEVLHYTTDDPDPDYLRMTTLGVYDGDGWRQDVLRANLSKDGVDNAIPTPPGRSSATAARTVHDTVTVDRLDAYWLPAPATPSAVQVKGPWMWEARSQSVFSTRSNTAKVGSYSVTAQRVLPDTSVLNGGTDALPAQVAPYDAPIPATDRVRRLTARIVAGQTTDYGRASALQAFFRDPTNRFAYTEQTDTGGSPDALEAFLANRRGFCEQYASAMAAMLRLSGVPSRVAVGFTPGSRQPDGSYLVTTDEAHAWPEAWFAGAGWVRFEPTPSRGGITPPTYADPTAPGAQNGLTPPQGPTAQGNNSLADETPAQRRERLQAERGAQTNAVPVGAAQSAHRQVPVRWVAVGVLGVVLLALPGLVNLLRRRLRWRAQTPETAWLQMRDDARDVGLSWDDALSPRGAAARLVTARSLPEGAAAAVGRLREAVERERYAAGAGAGPQGEDRLRADSALVRRALRRTATPARRLRAALLPPSTAGWASAAAGSRAADLLDAGDAALAAVARRLRRRPA